MRCCCKVAKSAVAREVAGRLLPERGNNTDGGTLIKDSRNKDSNSPRRMVGAVQSLGFSHSLSRDHPQNHVLEKLERAEVVDAEVLDVGTARERVFCAFCGLSEEGGERAAVLDS